MLTRHRREHVRVAIDTARPLVGAESLLPAGRQVGDPGPQGLPRPRRGIAGTTGSYPRFKHRAVAWPHGRSRIPSATQAQQGLPRHRRGIAGTTGSYPYDGKSRRAPGIPVGAESLLPAGRQVGDPGPTGPAAPRRGIAGATGSYPRFKHRAVAQPHGRSRIPSATQARRACRATGAGRRYHRLLPRVRTSRRGPAPR